MPYDPNIHHRRTIRLKGYDYTQPGAYFVTICTQHRECVFGQVVNGEMTLSSAGQMVETVWRELPRHYPGVAVDALVVMPNHVHGIIVLVGAGASACPDDSGRPQGIAPTAAGPGARPGQPHRVAPTMSLPDAVHRFKSLATARYRQGVRDDRWPGFSGRLWQRNYYERIIRTDEEMDRVRRYIADNPIGWDSDPENPSAVSR